jgi:galactonate dehydratase
VKDAATGLPEVVDGYFALPTGPGLGLKLNPDVIRAHPRQSIHFNLFADDWHLRKAVVE